MNLKATASNCRRSIKIYPDPIELRHHVEQRILNNGIIQVYIDNPLLLYGRKFDIRIYVLISQTLPTVKIYWSRLYYCRLSIDNYSLSDFSLHIHLTNAAIQKKQFNF